MRKSIAFAVLLCSCLSISLASGPIGNSHIADDLLTERLSTLNSQIDLRLTEVTKKKIEEYINYKRGAEKLISKSKVYFPIFEEQLKKYNIPEEFKYLPIVESNLRVSIKSRAGAVGLWQFMKRTGQSFGLQIGAEVDERMDVTKSSEAAAQYLLQLHHEFQDWTLVLAAYNAGAGGIRKAIRKSGKRNYWDIYDFLPKETRSYVPKFAAAAYLMNFHQDHDIYAPSPDVIMSNTISAKVFHEIDFTTIAQSSGAPLEIIESMNAQYFKGFIPDNTGQYLLRLPADEMNQFLSNHKSAQIDVSSLPAGFSKEKLRINKLVDIKSQRVEYAQIKKQLIGNKVDSQEFELIKLGKKETLSALAYRAGVSLDVLLKMNNLDSETIVAFDKYIKVPVSTD